MIDGISKNTMFQERLNDIRETKQQQWLLAYYVILMQSGIVGLANIWRPIFCEKKLLVIVSILISIFGSSIMFWYYNELKKDEKLKMIY